MYKGLSDIIQEINDKDYQAWEALYAHYYRALCSYSHTVVKDGPCAEDIVQDVLMKIWQSDVRFTDARDLGAYLYKAVYNNSVAYMRTSGNRAGILNHLYEESDRERRERIENGEETDFEFLAGVVGEEVIRELYLSIQELPEDRRRIMRLSIEGHSGAEIAEMLGVSINTVKTQKYRSYKFLKKRLNKYYYLLPLLLAFVDRP